MTNTIVYVSCADERVIERFAMDPDRGTMTHLGRTQIPGLSAPSASSPLAISPDHRFLYVALREDPYPVCSFGISPADGALTHLGTGSLPASMCYIETDPAGRWLFSASYGGAVVAAGRIDADGVVRAAPSQVHATPPKAHCALPDPSGRFVYVPCLGGDAVMCWALDAETGLAPLATATQAPLAAGAGPRHLTFNRAGTTAYLINELDGTVAMFARDATSGALTLRQTVPAVDGHPTGAAADIHLRPDERFLYASVRRDSTIGVFRVAEADGALTLVERIPVEKTPRAFEIDPRGKFLVCAGRDDAAIGVYAIDETTGGLSRQARIAVGGNPNWVEIIDLP